VEDSVTAQAITLVILLCNPTIAPRAAGSYARLLYAESQSHSFDAVTAAALICHESGWRPGAVSPDGEDYGLGQIRARYIGECARDLDPVSSPSPGCIAVKSRLLDGESNIRLMADHIMRWKGICRNRAGSGRARHWLAGYGGLSRPSQNQWCGRQRRGGRWTEVVHPKVREIMVLRSRLAKGLPPRPSSR
jgi:hypothetical protein